jgi:hypothetical protein
MTKYINTETFEYPFHPGDIILNGNHHQFAAVKEIEAPNVPLYSHAYELPPKFENGQWVQQWTVFTMTQEEIEANKAEEALLLPQPVKF